jgi:hypothetical protein
MPRILDLVEMSDGRLGIVLDMPLEARSSVSLWTLVYEARLRESGKSNVDSQQPAHRQVAKNGKP